VGWPWYAVPRLVPFLSFIKSSTQQCTCASPSPLFSFFSLSLSLYWHIVSGISISDRSYFRLRSWHRLSFPPLTLSHITYLGYTFHKPIKAHLHCNCSTYKCTEFNLCRKHSRHHLALPNLLSFSCVYLLMESHTLPYG